MSNPSLSSIAPRLAKLILLLSSEHDGEVLSAVAAIRRALKAQSLDLHDLANALSSDGHQAHRPRTEAPPPSHKEDAEFCLASECGWQKHERKFLTDMKFRPNALTEKQQSWLDALVGRAKAHEEFNQ